MRNASPGRARKGGRLETLPLRVTAANDDQAVAAFEPDGRGGFRPYGLMVFTVTDGTIATIIGFLSGERSVPFDAFGLETG